MICLACQFVFVSLNFTVGHGELPTRLPGDERERNCELSNEKTSGCLGYLLGWNPTQLCGDYVINHSKGPYETTSISWEVRVVFCVLFSWSWFCHEELVFVKYGSISIGPTALQNGFSQYSRWINIVMSRHQKKWWVLSSSTMIHQRFRRVEPWCIKTFAGLEGMKSYHQLDTIMVATHIIICYFHPELIGEMIQFDEYFSDGLVQPPTR